MLMVTKVVAAGVTALAMGGVPTPGADPAGPSLSASPVVEAQLNTSQASAACPSGCNVWRMIYDGR